MTTAWMLRAKPIAMALLLLGVISAQSIPVFQGVQTASASSATTLIVRMSAPVSHSEYRPSPGVLYVDIPNATTQTNAAPVKLPQGPITSYKVYSYKPAANRPSVLRLELTIAPNSNPQPVSPMQNNPNNLVVRVIAGSTPEVSAKSTTAASKATPAKPSPSPAAQMQTVSMSEQESAAQDAAAAAGSARLIDLLTESNDLGVAVLVKTTSPVRYRAYPVLAPYRYVIDFLHTGYAMRQHHWSLADSPVSGIRGSQFTPHTARIVLDLKEGVVPVISRAGNVIELDIPSVRSTPSRSNQASAAKSGSTRAPVPATTPKPAMPSQSRTASMRNASVHTGQFEEGTADMKSASFAQPGQQPSSALASKNGFVTQNRTATQNGQVRPAAQMNAKAPVAGNVPQGRPQMPASNNSQPWMAASNPPQMLAANNAPPAASAYKPSPRLEPTPRGVAPASLQAPMDSGVLGNIPVQQYTGERITLNLKNADLKDFFRLIHEVSGLNVVVDPNVNGSVTMVVEDVPWDQALDIVLRNSQLGRQLEGNVVRIATVATLQQEANAQAQLESARMKAAPLVTEVKQISYANASDLIPTLKKFSGDRGDITPDPRTNTLIIEAPADVMPTLNALIQRLDQKTPQVEVEARVVAATRNFSRELGVQLGFGTGNSSNAVGGTQQVGVSETSIGGLTPKYAIVGTGNIPLNVNLPANAPTSGISFINASNTFRIDAILTAAEQKGLGHVLSRPKVVTQNNAQASVQQGVKIPIQTTINNTISVQFFAVTLRLTVTPQITADRTVFMNVDVENDQLDPGIPRVNGIPAIDTQNANTKVLVADGGTVVIGGVMINNAQANLFQVPVLGSLPLIGDLFKHTSNTNQSQELLFFITPHIV